MSPIDNDEASFNYNVTWIQVGQDLDGYGVETKFGFNTALSADGTILAAGGPFSPTSSQGEAAGVVRVYRYQGTQWQPMGQILEGEFEGDFCKYTPKRNTRKLAMRLIPCTLLDGQSVKPCLFPTMAWCWPLEPVFTMRWVS